MLLVLVLKKEKKKLRELGTLLLNLHLKIKYTFKIFDLNRYILSLPTKHNYKKKIKKRDI